MLDSRPPASSPIYRAYRVTAAGRFTGAPTILEALNDEGAIAQAHRLVDGVGVEVWDRTRRVVSLPPKEASDAEPRLSPDPAAR